MKTLKRLSFLLLTTIFLTPFSACSDDDDDNDDSTISTDALDLIGGDYRIAEIHEAQVYYGDSTDGDISYITYNDDNRVIETVTGSETETFTYNSDDQLTGYEYTDEDYPDYDYSYDISWSGSTATVTDTSSVYYEYSFNSAMQLQKIEYYYSYGGVDYLYGYSDYTWSDNNLTNIAYYSYDYDMVSTQENKASLLNSAIKIDPDQLLLKSSDEMSLSYETTYTYDGYTNPLRVFPLAPFTNPALFSNNNITEKTDTYDDEDYTDVYEYTYTYNSDEMPETQTYTTGDYWSDVNTYVYEEVE
jgi:hypothetical protein